MKTFTTLYTGGEPAWDAENLDSMMVWAKALQEEIDKEMIEELKLVTLLQQGWIEPTFKYNSRNPDIGAWVHTHTQGEYKNLNGKWIFKNGADATAFTLKWA